VSLGNYLTVARSRLRLPRRTIRLRLTSLYSLLFLAAAAGLLAVTYLLVRSATGGIDNSLIPTRSLAGPSVSASPVNPTTSESALTRGQLKAQAYATHAIDMHQLLVWSAIALAVMAVLAVALGWLVAGHVLQPLRKITVATQQISEQNLHKRLNLEGPGDEVKDLADTIDGLLCRLDAAFDAQRRFVANASHELRTPLTLNRALVEFTLRNPDATIDDLRAMGEDLLTSGEQQEQVIDALLTLAISARGLERREPFDLSEICVRVLLDPHPEIEQLGLDVRTAFSPAFATGDPRLAERLVANLFDNALRHNVAGGYVSVASRTQADHAVLAIANSGPLIRQEDVDRLFEPFQRLESDRAHHPDGHGLGLSIVRSVAIAHGGAITACARPEGGLGIVVTLPLATNHNSLSESGTTSASTAEPESHAHLVSQRRSTGSCQGKRSLSSAEPLRSTTHENASMSAMRDELHRLVDQLPGTELWPAMELVRNRLAEHGKSRRRPAFLESFEAEPDLAQRAKEILSTELDR
jgi:signal transduction histidine kinase